MYSRISDLVWKFLAVFQIVQVVHGAVQSEFRATGPGNSFISPMRKSRHSDFPGPLESRSERHKRSPGDMSHMKQIITPDGKTVLVDLPFEGQRRRNSLGSSLRILKDLNLDGPRLTRQTDEFETPHKTTQFPREFCLLPRDMGVICPGYKRGAYLENFYYRHAENRCERFIYNGCDGNANRFSTLWECAQRCGHNNATLA